MKLLPLFFISICLFNCGLTKKGVGSSIHSDCEVVPSIFEIEYQPTIKNGYRFVRHNGLTIDELNVILFDGNYECSLTKNGTSKPVNLDQSYQDILINNLDQTNSGNFIQSCSSKHYDHPVDSIFFIEDGTVKFQYVSVSNTPLRLNDEAITILGDLNYDVMRKIYDLYSKNR